MRFANQILQRRASFSADIDQARRLQRYRSSGVEQSAPRRKKSLRRLEPALQIVPGFACRALDEIAKITLRNCRIAEQPMNTSTLIAVTWFGQEHRVLGLDLN